MMIRLTIALACGYLLGQSVTLNIVQTLSPSETYTSQSLLLNKYKKMIQRDDILLNLFLERPWERDKKVYHRWYIISNGSEVHAFTQYPNPDKTYQLNY